MATIESLFALAGRGARGGGSPANGSSVRFLGLAEEMFGRLVLAMPIAAGGAVSRGSPR